MLQTVPPRLRLAATPFSITVCFWFIPPKTQQSLDNLFLDDPNTVSAIDVATKKVHASLLHHGHALVDYAKIVDRIPDCEIKDYLDFTADVREYASGSVQHLPACLCMPLSLPKYQKAFWMPFLTRLRKSERNDTKTKTLPINIPSVYLGV